MQLMVQVRKLGCARQPKSVLTKGGPKQRKNPEVIHTAQCTLYTTQSTKHNLLKSPSPPYWSSSSFFSFSIFFHSSSNPPSFSSPSTISLSASPFSPLSTFSTASLSASPYPPSQFSLTSPGRGRGGSLPGSPDPV